MKHLINPCWKTLFTLLFVATFLTAYTQDLVLQVGTEMTVAGSQYSINAAAETKSLWSLGGFYQANINVRSVEGAAANNQSFYGVTLQAPLVRYEKLALLASLRTGFVDNKFLVIVPSIETRWHITEWAGLAVGSGLRMGHPSFTGRLFLKIF